MAFDPHFSNVVLLAHFDGADTSTVFVDESNSGHTLSAAGNAQLDTSSFKFGTASLQFSIGGRAVIPDSADWQLGAASADPWTVELWLAPNDVTSHLGMVIGQRPTGASPNANHAWSIFLVNGILEFNGQHTTTNAWSVSQTSGGSMSVGTWYHVAVDKDATGKVRLYRDGVMIGSGIPANSGIINAATDLTMGAPGGGSPGLNARIDDVRITKGVARYASDAGFSVPTEAFPDQGEGIASITPNVGSDAGGTSVTIVGAGFTAATDVTFDGNSATSIVISDDFTITCDTPAGTAGFVDVVVVRPTTNLTAVDGFQYTTVAAPVITSVSPDEGPVTGGDTITITGTGLDIVTDVLVNGISASFSIINSTTIEFISPVSAVSGLVDVVVDSLSGDDTLEDGFDYLNVVRLTQAPFMVVHLPNQPARITQTPLMVVHLPIQGARITQTPVLPVWTPTPIPFPAPIVPEVPLNEKWTWKTTIVTGENGREQRARLRENPRITLEFETTIEDEAERRDVWDLLVKYSKREFPFPLYQYSTGLTAGAAQGATALAFDASRIEARVGEQLALFDPELGRTLYVDCEALTDAGATVSPLPVAVPASWLVCGVGSFRTDPVIGLTMNSIAGSIGLILVSTQSRDFVNEFSDAVITTYDGICLIGDRPLANNNVDEDLTYNTRWLDNEINAPEPVTNWAVPYISGSREYLTTRYGLHKWRAIADHLKGRQGVFLLPTFRDDFPLTEAPALSGVWLQTSRIQFFDYWRDTAYRYLRIETANGVIYRRITEVLANYDPDGNPVSLDMKLNTALGGAAGDNVISRVSFMLLCRLDSDTIEIEHGDFNSVISLSIRGVSA